MRNLLQSKGGKQMNLNKQFIKADIEYLLERIGRAKLRKKNAQTTIDTLNLRIKAKQALL